VPVSRRPHRPQRGERPVHQAGDVDVEHRLALVEALLPGRAAEEDARVVDPEVERAGASERLGEAAAGDLVADVQRQAPRLAADLRRGAVGGAGVDVGEVDAVAAVRQLGGDRAAEAAASAGDDRRPHRSHHNRARLGLEGSRSYHRWAGRADRGGRENPSRKVRTPQGKAVGNAHPGKPAGKCHRNDTADGAATRESRTGKGEMVR
jgi:hypothetical protein